MTSTRVRAARSVGVCVLHSVILAAVPTTTYAQWTVTSLRPTGASDSVVYDISAGRQVGRTLLGTSEHASLWNGSADSWIDLNPPSASESTARGISGSVQVGYATFAGSASHAGLWHGSADSWVDLHPAAANESRALGVYNDQQTGNARIGEASHASLWSGTAESWVDLHPQGAIESHAYAVAAGQQVGTITSGLATHASLWRGTAESWIDLNPAGVSLGSAAFGVYAGHQVGFANAANGYPHASLWNGSAESWVDLNPVTASGSVALGTSGIYQVGNALVGTTDRASLWSGTAASWIDLHAFLPSDFSSSVALSIASDDRFIYAAGFGFNTLMGRQEALLWTRPVPAPSAGAILGMAGFIVSRRRR